MRGDASLCFALFCFCACGDKAPSAPPPSAPEIAPAPAAPPTVVKPPSASNPCDNPAPIILELSAGITQSTPWGLEIKYVLDEDKKLGTGYMFQLRSGERRWETRRDNSNWNKSLTWRGFCWRGAERPERRASEVKIQIAPVCKDGKLQELGGCGDVFGSK
jgi:hypothetical protein